MAEFVLEKNYFKSNSSFKHQISGTGIGSIFAVDLRKANKVSSGFGLDILMILFHLDS